MLDIFDFLEFKFSIVDLIVLTACVAFVFALPPEAARTVLAISFSVFLLSPLLLFITIFSAKRRAERKATSQRAMIKVLVRSFFYSCGMLAIGVTAIVLKSFA